MFTVGEKYFGFPQKQVYFQHNNRKIQKSGQARCTDRKHVKSKLLCFTRTCFVIFCLLFVCLWKKG